MIFPQKLLFNGLSDPGWNKNRHGADQISTTPTAHEDRGELLAGCHSTDSPVMYLYIICIYTYIYYVGVYIYINRYNIG
jgi:hypothetical protein